MSRTSAGWARPACAALTLAFLVWRVGAGPFVDGVRTVDAAALAAATGLAGMTTVCCAWRWKVVARGLGIELSLPAAVAAYYRSLFLNVTLPGGVVGDVHRGISNGRDVRDVGRGVRAVVWERTAGQVVQGIATLVVLLALPSPVRGAMPVVGLALAGAVLALALGARVGSSDGRSRIARFRRAAVTDIRSGLLGRGAWPRIVLASLVVVAGHAATFMIAARSAGADEPVSRLLPLALLAMLAMVLPSIGGFGPREGVTAWVFAAAGLGAGVGVATAVVYGVMVLVSSLPGGFVLVVGWIRRARCPERPEAHLSWRLGGGMDRAADV
jgi:glycosyltransferase 2 family protein